MHENRIATERAVQSIIRRALRRGRTASDLEREILSQLRREKIAAGEPIADAGLIRRIAAQLGDAILGASPSATPGNETGRRESQWCDTTLTG